jgi:GGDEF domain-containing protein
VIDLIGAAFAELQLGDAGRGLWEPAVAHVVQVAEGDDEPFLGVIEESARGAGLSQSVPLASLLEAYGKGSEGLCAGLLAAGTREAEEASLRLAAVERLALERIACGYSAGLEENIVRLQREADEASPVDSTTGAMKPETIAHRLSLEVNRCQRMEQSLGLLELAVEDSAPEAASCTRDQFRDIMPTVGECLRENVRRYDSIGLTSDGGFLVVLPDISRRGLAGAADRLRRQLAECAGRGAGAPFVFALAHYDYVDVNAAEMLTALERSMHEARLVRDAQG